MPSRLKLNTFVPYRLSIAANAVSDVVAKAYRSHFGLTVPEWRLVAVLGEEKELSQLDLGLATRMDKVTVSRAAIALTGRGLVRRSVNPKDLRSQLLSLTHAGADVYAQVAPKALELERALLAEFDGPDLKAMMSMFQRLEAAAERLSKDS
jgi:DNA-binding MarR family transcriptional regulator